MKKDSSALVLLLFVMFVSMILGVAFADEEKGYNEFKISTISDDVVNQ